MRMIDDIADELGIEYVYTYDLGNGLKIRKGEDKKVKDYSISEISSALSHLRGLKEKALVIFLGAASIFNENPDSKASKRVLKNIINEIKEEGLPLMLLFVSTALSIPEDIERETIVMDIPYPSRDEIQGAIQDFVKEHGIQIKEELKTSLLNSLTGLSDSEIDNMLHICLASDNKLNEKSINIIISQKEQIIRKGGFLEFISIKDENNKAGALKKLQDWLADKSKIFKDIGRAKEENVDMPKGVFLFGIPGCGKSLSAKITAGLFDIPLLRLDIGKIMGMYQGQSEENLRQAIKLAESISPSILWIDEIEKALSGATSGGGHEGSETSVRIFGYLLTWMQEKKEPVFVFATANNIQNIPPEFMRKGRFDEIFFIDFPERDSLKEIFDIHLNKRRKELSSQSIDKVVQQIPEQKKYTGADVEAIVVEAIQKAFINKSQVTENELIEVLKNFKPFSETHEKSLKGYYDLVKEHGITIVK